jgi:hypothetical protein
VDYFSVHPKNYFAGTGILGLLFGREEVYGIGLARLIGGVYNGNFEENANVHLFADGFAQAGILGVIISSLVAMAAFRVLDRLAVDRDTSLLLPLCVPMAFSLTNGAIFSLLAGGGFWMLIVLTYFFPHFPKNGSQLAAGYRRQ